jgi:hypothetical protein
MEKQNKLRNPLRQVRIPRRRASDGMIKVNMEVLFEEKIVEYEQMIQTKQKLLTVNRGRD